MKYLFALLLAALPLAATAETLEAIEARVIPQQQAVCFLDARGAPTVKDKSTQTTQCIVALDPKDPDHAVLFLADFKGNKTDIGSVWKWSPTDGATLLWVKGTVEVKR